MLLNKDEVEEQEEEGREGELGEEDEGEGGVRLEASCKACAICWGSKPMIRL